MTNPVEVAGEALAEFPLFAQLPAAQRVLISRAAHAVSFEAGRRVFCEGQPARGCWLIRAGHVAIDAHVPVRGAVVVQTLGPGDVLGWSWLVPPYRWHFGPRRSSRSVRSSWIPCSYEPWPSRTPASGTGSRSRCSRRCWTVCRPPGHACSTCTTAPVTSSDRRRTSEGGETRPEGTLYPHLPRR